MARSKQSTTQLSRDSRIGLVVARGRDLGIGGIGFGTILPNEESHQQINLWPTQTSISSLLYIVVFFCRVYRRIGSTVPTTSLLGALRSSYC
jgi:hypothetical protein